MVLLVNSLTSWRLSIKIERGSGVILMVLFLMMVSSFVYVVVLVLIDPIFVCYFYSIIENSVCFYCLMW